MATIVWLENLNRRKSQMAENSEQKTTNSEEEREPCPTPLLWQDIVLSFHEEMRQGPVEFAGGQVTATQFGTGLPLVFLPGSVASPRLYALTAWLLKDDRQCWLLDHPTFENRPDDSKLVQESAAAYAHVLDDLFGGAVDVYSSSYGVQVCLEMLLSHPSSVKRAVFQSGWTNRTFTGREKFLLKFGRKLPITLRRLPLWVSTQVQNHRPWFPPYDETRFNFLLQETSTIRVSDLCQRLLAASEINFMERLSAIEKEVLLIESEGDGDWILSQSSQMADKLQHSKVEELHTSGHYPYLTHPHRLVKLLRQFFEIPKSAPALEPNSQVPQVSQ